MANRWKYTTQRVTVGENSIEVRGLTAGERMEFVKLQEANRKAKAAGELPEHNVPRAIFGFGVVTVLTDEERQTMPGDLLDASVEKILELTGVKADEKKEEPAPAS